MAKQDGKIEVSGVVTKKLKGNQYEVTLENDHVVTCTLAGKLSINKIKVIPGDEVEVSVSMYDLTRGIITFRGKKRDS